MHEFGCERDARKSEWRTCELSVRVLSTDCGMNCHKQCKDLVVFECKKRIKSPAVSMENISSVVPMSNLCPLGTKDLLHGKQEPGTFAVGVHRKGQVWRVRKITSIAVPWLIHHGF